MSKNSGFLRLKSTKNRLESAKLGQNRLELAKNSLKGDFRFTVKAQRIDTYHRGQNDDLPNFIPDEFFEVIPCIFVYTREVLGELMLNCLAKIALPKLFAN